MIFAALLLGISALTAQPFAKGDHAINVGIGFGNTAYFGSYYTGFYPSISASYELGIVEVPMGSELTGVLSVGGYLGWSASKYNYSAWSNDDWYYSGSNFMIAARGNYHFIFHDKLDPYAGILLGVDIQSWKWHGDPGIPASKTLESDIDPAFGAYVGARWFFSDNFAAYAELGYLISIFNIGVSFKIPVNN